MVAFVSFFELLSFLYFSSFVLSFVFCSFSSPMFRCDSLSACVFDIYTFLLFGSLSLCTFELGLACGEKQHNHLRADNEYRTNVPLMPSFPIFHLESIRNDGSGGKRVHCPVLRVHIRAGGRCSNVRNMERKQQSDRTSCRRASVQRGKSSSQPCYI